MTLASSLNMSKMATPIKRKKTAKTQTRFYFAAEELKPRNSILTVSNKRLKVYKKLSPKTGDKISPRGVRPATIGTDARTGGGNGLKSYRPETPSLRTSEVPIRSDLNGRHAVSVETRTRQILSYLGKIEKTRLKVSNLAASGQKVSNPRINERGLEHGARPEDGWGKPVGQSSAPRPRSPGGQSPARLLRGSTPSENTGLTARRPKGHYDKHKTSEMVSKKVSMKVRWGSDGEESAGTGKGR